MSRHRVVRPPQAPGLARRRSSTSIPMPPASIAARPSTYVAVPPDRDATPVRTFPTFTGDLYRLADWLTGLRRDARRDGSPPGCIGFRSLRSWKPAASVVSLVNARHVKNVPGRKSDVSDCEWLRDLHIDGTPARAAFGRPMPSWRCAPISGIARRSSRARARTSSGCRRRSCR